MKYITYPFLIAIQRSTNTYTVAILNKSKGIMIQPACISRSIKCISFLGTACAAAGFVNVSMAFCTWRRKKFILFNGFSNHIQLLPNANKCKSCKASKRDLSLFIFHSQICVHVLTICVRGKLKDSR